MSPFTVLILIAFAVSAFGFIDEETKLNSTDELSSSEDFPKQIDEWEGKIFGGSNAEPGQFPHQVILRNIYRNFCGGSILNRLFVLTAAHCTQRKNGVASFILVVVGARRQHNDGIIHHVQSVHNHPEYTSANRTNDISIIRTVNNILYSPYVFPVRLPISNVPEAGNYKVTVSGWGATSHPGMPPVILQFQDGFTLNREECAAQFGPVFGRFVHENTVCVQNTEGRGTCMGDSGNALITPRGVQVGVVSWGRSCGSGRPDVYANVWSHIEWIRATIRLN